MMDISQLSDAELLSLVAAGDAAAEEALAERYSRLVRICARPLFLMRKYASATAFTAPSSLLPGRSILRSTAAFP